MALLVSSTTVYAQAYLTELGRQYLFDGLKNPRYRNIDGTIIDLLKIERFSLEDPDINYKLPLSLESGDIPDISGENESAIKGTKGRTLRNLISPGGTNLPGEDVKVIQYKTSTDKISIDLKQTNANLSTVYSQQLLTFIDGKLAEDGQYSVTPTNYGKNKVENSELIITIKDATLTTPGYRLRIFYPTTGGRANMMTFQFEKGTAHDIVISGGSGTQPLTAASITSTVATGG